jgi:hypothetical protein
MGALARGTIDRTCGLNWRKEVKHFAEVQWLSVLNPSLARPAALCILLTVDTLR